MRRVVPLVWLGVFATCGEDDTTSGLVQSDVGFVLEDITAPSDGVVPDTDDTSAPPDTRVDTTSDGASETSVSEVDEDTADLDVAPDSEGDTVVTDDTGEPDVAPDVVACVPTTEVCNGKNDDCDDFTDEDTEPECFPYLCAGEDGCGAQCSASAQCAAGNWCDAGTCVTTGEDGTACEDDDACASGHCANGFCCIDGLCCQKAEDCALLNADECTSANGGGCAGTTTVGVCGEGNVCEPLITQTPEVCTAFVCGAAHCEGGDRVSARLCQGNGACGAGVVSDCEAYACHDGECLDACNGSSECASNAKCLDGGVCGSLPDGVACTSDGSCASQHCANGYCCGDGACCAQTADCAFKDQAATCDNASTCSGSRKVGVCGAGHRCDLATEGAPEACAGIRCGAGECTNLEGGGVVEEGLKRKVCSDDGQCMTQTEDCRVQNLVSYCAPDSTFYPACAGCSPEREACVVFGNPCYCHD